MTAMSKCFFKNIFALFFPFLSITFAVCDRYARYIVHCRLIGGGQEEEQEQEAELEEAGEDRTPPVNLSTVGDVATAASDVTSQTLPNTLGWL